MWGALTMFLYRIGHRWYQLSSSISHILETVGIVKVWQERNRGGLSYEVANEAGISLGGTDGFQTVLL